MAQQAAATREDLDQEWFREFAQRWLEAWNSHDPDRLVGFMTDDIVYDDSAWPKTMRGHADVREFLDHTWRALPDLRFELREGPYVRAGEPKAAFGGTGTVRTPAFSTRPGWRPPARAWSSTGRISTSTETARSRGCGSCSTWPTPCASSASCRPPVADRSESWRRSRT